MKTYWDKTKSVYVLGIMLSCLLSCSSSEKNIVAIVNGTRITVGDFRNELRLYHFNKTSMKSGASSEKVLDTKKEILNSMIREQILLLEAKKLGIEATESEVSKKVKDIQSHFPGNTFTKYLMESQIKFDAWKDKIKNSIIIQKLTEKILMAPVSIDEDEIKEYYEKNEEQFTLPDQIHAFQIVVKSEEEAYKIYRELRNKKDFEELARKHSVTPEAKLGGDMGYFSRGSMPAAFDNVLFSLNKGRISKVVKSNFGYHIFKVTDKMPSRLKTFEEARGEIIKELTKTKKDEMFSEWFKDKITKAKIKRNNSLLVNIK